MSDQPDPAHILFPSDAPTQPPAWLETQRADATSRLIGNQNRQEIEKPVEKPDIDANALFPSERKGPDYVKAVADETNTALMDATINGETERVDALKTETAALSKDFEASGSDPVDISQAFSLLRETQGIGTWTDEQYLASRAKGEEAVREAGIPETDLNAARAFINDLAIVSPHIKQQLEAYGAGNDIRMIQLVVKEAKRRGYK